MIMIHKIVTSILLTDYCVLSVSTLMKQAAILDKLTQQESEGHLQTTESEELNSANHYVSS